MQNVIKVLGWTCSPCKTKIVKLLHEGDGVLGLGSCLGQGSGSRFQALEEEIGQMKTKIGALTTILDDFVAAGANVTSDQPLQHSDGQGSQAIKAPPSVSWFEVVKKTVDKQLKEAHRRAKNVVISGLPENADPRQDITVFTHLCKLLDAKPTALFTQRLGKPSDRPRRLLVALASEGDASSVLSVAKNLRSFPEANGIYFNHDLTKEEAKAAFERRKERRENTGLEGRTKNPYYSGRVFVNSSFSLRPRDSQDRLQPSVQTLNSQLNPSALSFTSPAMKHISHPASLSPTQQAFKPATQPTLIQSE